MLSSHEENAQSILLVYPFHFQVFPHMHPPNLKTKHGPFLKINALQLLFETTLSKGGIEIQ